MKNIIILIFPLIFFNCSRDGDSNNQLDLLGSWELMRFENDSSGQILLPPESEATISITFQNQDFNGNTGSNSYFGKYTIDFPKLTLLNLVATEVAESLWGQRYFDALNESYDPEKELYLLEFSIVPDTLEFEYLDFEKMVFAKK